MDKPINTQKKVPAIRFQGFSGEWEERTLGEVVDFYRGLTYSPNNIVNRGGCFVLRSSNVKGGEIVRADDVYVNSKVVDSDNVQIGDIIVVVRNGSRSLIGKHAQIKQEMANTVIGAFMTGVRSEHPCFINALLDTNQFFKEVEKNLGATINQITNGAFKKMQFWFSNPKEQTQIGDFFQALDDLIAKHEQKHAKLSKIKQALLGKLFPQAGETVPQMRFIGFSGDWEEKTLGEITKITTGSSNRQDSGLKGKYTFFDRSEDIRRSNIFLFDCEAIIVAGEGSDFIPKYYVGKFDLHQRTYAIMDFQDSEGKFLFYYILFFRKHFLDNAVGSTVKSLRLPMFQTMKIKLPNKKEQTQIGNLFHKLDTLIDQYQQQITTLKNIKQGYLNKMFI